MVDDIFSQYRIPPQRRHSFQAYRKLQQFLDSPDSDWEMCECPYYVAIQDVNSRVSEDIGQERARDELPHMRPLYNARLEILAVKFAGVTRSCG